VFEPDLSSSTAVLRWEGRKACFEFEYNGSFDRLDEGQNREFEAKISRETHVFWVPSLI
jgi:hypothetical protein